MSPDQKPNLVIPYPEFANPHSLLHLSDHLEGSAPVGGGGSKHAYSQISVFIESSLICISQNPIIIIIRLQNANTVHLPPNKHFGINTTKLPGGFIPRAPLA